MSIGKYYKIRNINPYDHQIEAWNILKKEKPLLLLAGTGSGKTEAVLYPCLELSKKCILVFPTRSLVEDQTSRISMDLKRLIKNSILPKSKYYLTIDTGNTKKSIILPNGKSKYNTLLKGDIVITTLDEFIYRFFGFGKKRWSLIYPTRIMNPENSVIVFDEAHVYEDVSFTNFIKLIQSLVGNGVLTTVMSATIPENLVSTFTRYGFEKAFGKSIKGNRSFQFLTNLNTEEERLQKIIELVKKNIDKRIIVVRNSVLSSVNTYRKLQKFSPILYHGRMYQTNREINYKKIKKLDDEKKPYVLVTTHAIEVGCDLDSELLITDFCNPDQLIQRVGRCARRKETTGEAVLLGNNFLESDSYLFSNVNYENYVKILKRGVIDEELKGLIQVNLIKDPLVETLFDGLYDYVYRYDERYYQLHNSGFVVTRSWTPTAKVYIFKEDVDKKEIFDKIKKSQDLDKTIDEIKESIVFSEPLYISLDLLSSKGEKIKTKSVLVVATQGEEDNIIKRSTINAYISKIYIFLCEKDKYLPDASIGMVKVPKIFKKEIKKSQINKIQLKISKSMGIKEQKIVYMGE